MNKKTILTALLAILGFALIYAQPIGNSVTDVILKGYSAKVFTTVPVTDREIDLIVKCGMQAQSGMNRQPWKFTVIKDQARTGEILPNITAGNILIIISGQKQQDGSVSLFDCGLATQNMFVAAEGLGLGAHIYAGPVAKLNSAWKEQLGIPEDYTVVMVLRVGNVEKGVDAVSGASTRKKQEEVVTYK
jgi:nitroreductase